MKNILLLISLLALSPSLIGSENPTPHYSFSGQEAIEYLIRNGHCRECDLSKQDLRAAIAAVNAKNRQRSTCKITIDLSWANLEGANLSGADLSYAEMRDANLRGANMTKANLVGAIMTGADLTNATLVGANLSETEMKNVNLTGANLTTVNLRRAHMHQVNMTNANTKGADMTGVYYLDTVIGYSSTK